MPNKILSDKQKLKIEDTKAIEEFTKDQIERFENLSQALNRYNQEYQKLTNQFRNMSRNDENYEEVRTQLKDLQYNINGIVANREKISESLKKLGAEDTIHAQEVLDSQQELQDKVDDALANVMATGAEIAHINAKQYKSQADYEKLAALEEQLENDKAELKSAEAAKKASEALQRKEKSDSIFSAISGTSSLPKILQDIASTGASKKPQSNTGQIISEVSNKIGGPVGKILNVVGKIFDVAVAIRKSVDNWVNEAAAVLSSNVGRINAALDGTGQTYKDISEKMVESLGLSRFVKQTDYISQIANLTSRGITYNVEQRALLETIKDKAIASFDSMDANLLRLIRLTQTDITSSQFGLEAALRNTLNKVFKDSTYLQGMYDSIAGAITDAVMISGRKDVTEYSSVIQTWMGAMYESGVNTSMVDKLANAINYLGSGNVSALASDQDIQRLILLSMDSINMDYADILQQGLSASDISNLLSAVVKYLSQIESNTKDNNVLASSYTNLFGMTMADLQAFKNLNSKMGSLTYVNSSSAMSETNRQLTAIQSFERTIAAEQIQNVFDNARFTFGSSIAEDASSYMSWKVSNLMLDVVNSVASSDWAKKSPLAKRLATAVAIPAEFSIFWNELRGIMSIAKALPSLFTSENTGLNTLVNGPSTYGDYTSTSASISQTNSDFKTVNTLSRIQSNSEYQTQFQSFSTADWESPEEEKDETLESLKEIKSTIVQAEANSAHKAFATYLVGMTDNTLRSFASIFADEDAMASTFSGDNNVLKNNLFKFADDTTSNSTTTNNNSTTTNKATTTNKTTTANTTNRS